MYVFLVCFADLKFAPASIQSGGELQIQHTKPFAAAQIVTAISQLLSAASQPAP